MKNSKKVSQKEFMTKMIQWPLLRIFFHFQAIIIQDFTRLQFVSGLKIIQNYLGQEEFLIMTNRYQKLATATIDFNEINFRILKANVDSVIRGTKCDRKLKHHDDHDDYFWLGEHSNNHTQIEDRPVHDTPNYDEQSDYYG